MIIQAEFLRAVRSAFAASPRFSIIRQGFRTRRRSCSSAKLSTGLQLGLDAVAGELDRVWG